MRELDTVRDCSHDYAYLGSGCAVGGHSWQDEQLLDYVWKAVGGQRSVWASVGVRECAAVCARFGCTSGQFALVNRQHDTPHVLGAFDAALINTAHGAHQSLCVQAEHGRLASSRPHILNILHGYRLPYNPTSYRTCAHSPRPLND